MGTKFEKHPDPEVVGSISARLSLELVPYFLLQNCTSFLPGLEGKQSQPIWGVQILEAGPSLGTRRLATEAAVEKAHQAAEAEAKTGGGGALDQAGGKRKRSRPKTSHARPEVPPFFLKKK